MTQKNNGEVSRPSTKQAEYRQDSKGSIVPPKGDRPNPVQPKKK